MKLYKFLLFLSLGLTITAISLVFIDAGLALAVSTASIIVSVVGMNLVID